MASKTECKVIVLVRLDSGEEVTVSVKAVNKPFSIQDLRLFPAPGGIL